MISEARRDLDAWFQSVDDLLADLEPAPSLSRPEDRPELIGKLWTIVPKDPGRQLHLRVGDVAGTEMVQLVDYLPATGRYENAFLVERHLLGRLQHELGNLSGA